MTRHPSYETRRHARHRAQGFEDSIFPKKAHATYTTVLPQAPKEKYPYHLVLDDVLPEPEIKAIKEKKAICFHAVGDTGGIHNKAYEDINIQAMENDLSDTNHVQPSFLYHLGDVVYYNGEHDNYYDQFYEAFEFYPKSIFAIPGNHDGSVPPHQTSGSLESFIENFCADKPKITEDAQGITTRDAMTQPYVYWTLEAPFVTFIGLYSNTDEHEGSFDDEQLQWFKSELKAALGEKALIVTVHHPPYSGDTARGSSTRVAEILDNAFDETNKLPDLVLSGHVHNYQRFTRLYKEQQIQYVVAGAGGYPAKHYMLKGPHGTTINVPVTIADKRGDITLENYDDNRFGYLLLKVTETTIEGRYIATAYHNEAFHAESEQVDMFQFEWHKNKLIRGGANP